MAVDFRAKSRRPRANFEWLLAPLAVVVALLVPQHPAVAHAGELESRAPTWWPRAVPMCRPTC